MATLFGNKIRVQYWLTAACSWLFACQLFINLEVRVTQLFQRLAHPPKSLLWPILELSSSTLLCTHLTKFLLNFRFKKLIQSRPSLLIFEYDWKFTSQLKSLPQRSSVLFISVLVMDVGVHTCVSCCEVCGQPRRNVINMWCASTGGLSCLLKIDVELGCSETYRRNVWSLITLCSSLDQHDTVCVWRRCANDKKWHLRRQYFC